MLGRLGIAGRLVLILLIVLVPLALVGIGADWWARAVDTGTALRLPLPDQLAAIVEALERTQGEKRKIVLRAVNSDTLRVRVTAQRPELPKDARRLPVAEWIIASYLETLNGRSIEVGHVPASGSGPLQRFQQWFSPLSQAPLRITVAMAEGDYAVMETHGPPTQRLGGLPVGFWVGLLGVALSGLAIFAIWRETRPLAALARSVSAFSGDGQIHPLTPRGAPDVRSLIAAVNDMQGRITALVKGRTILLGAVSHDLKTYITRLRLRVEGLEDEGARDKAIRDLEDMTALIDNAIAIARGAAGSGGGTVDLGALVAEEAQARGCAALRTMLPRRRVAVHGDAIGLRRMLANLIDNALRYGEHCEVALAVEPECVRLTVDDDGPGIPVAERGAVLEPFYRLEGSRNRDTGGSGLGLAIVRQIVDAHRGAIVIEDGPLGGARLRIELPVADARP